MADSIVIADYNPAWPEQFEDLRKTVAMALGPKVVAIEHVGSTSVPGLAAKPIIDFDIILLTTGQVPGAIAQLGAIGYQHRGDLGITGREAFRTPPGTVPHHPYIVAEGNTPLRHHLAFRDRLRVDAGVRAEYERLKRRLAAEFGSDIAGYTEAKTAFVHRILEEELGAGSVAPA